MEKDSHYILFSVRELCALYKLNTRLKKLNSNILEVGVFRGVSLSILGHSKKNTDSLYGVDTFSGLPVTCSYENRMSRGLFFQTPSAAIDKTDTPNTFIIKGKFPNETKHIFNDKMFKLVHLDTDIFQSTLESLHYVESKVVDGGFVVVHDYGKLSGVTKAVKSFLKDKASWHQESRVDSYVFLKKN